MTNKGINHKDLKCVCFMWGKQVCLQGANQSRIVGRLLNQKIGVLGVKRWRNDKKGLFTNEAERKNGPQNPSTGASNQISQPRLHVPYKPTSTKNIFQYPNSMAKTSTLNSKGATVWLTLFPQPAFFVWVEKCVH